MKAEATQPQTKTTYTVVVSPHDQSYDPSMTLEERREAHIWTRELPSLREAIAQAMCSVSRELICQYVAWQVDEKASEEGVSAEAWSEMWDKAYEQIPSIMYDAAQALTGRDTSYHYDLGYVAIV